MEISIRAGQLRLQLDKGAVRLDELLDFASRENPQRGFLFVSKVLGKHIPVKPSVMRARYDELAQLCGAGSETFVVGMAETATGLGAGVADSLAMLEGQGAVTYQHTTRHKLDHAIWLTLDESHSHAVDHILYSPHEDVMPAISAAERLILVDDEISTGRTLHLLACKLLPHLPRVRELLVVSIVSWLNDGKRARFNDLPVLTRFVNLMAGQFVFEPAEDFKPSLPANVDKGICCDRSRDDIGRCGIRLPYEGKVPMPDLTFASKTTLVGTGEHLFLPFLAAEALEMRGYDVVFQSTTRSPILEGDAIGRKLTFSDPGKEVCHFIYNLPPDRSIRVMLEDERLTASNGLVALLNGKESRDAA